jgi:hypothetical protein
MINEILHTITIWFNHNYMNGGQLDVMHLLKTLFMALIVIPLPLLILASPLMFITSKIRSLILPRD